MAYVDEIMESVLARNPGEPEFHQAVREVLSSIAPVIAKHEADYRENKILERTAARFILTEDTAFSLTARSDRIREDFVSTRR